MSQNQIELAGAKVLIVEDNPTNREILLRHTRHWGLAPQAVASASEALAQIQADQFALIILDWQLPDSNGIKLARQIRESAHSRNASLILLSSTPVRTNDSRLAPFGIAAVVSKPIRRAQLLTALQRALDPEFEKESRKAAKAAESASLAERLPLRILLADDNLVNQKVGALMLQRFGYRCEIAGNGAEALDALERQSFDIIFLDVEMPEMDGYEVTRQIRERWPASNRPRIIAMTANALCGDREKCLEAGMDDYIVKPVSLEALQQALITWGGGGRAGNLDREAAQFGAMPEVATSKDALASLPAHNAASINWNRLTQLTDGDPALFQEFTDLYVSQTADALRDLESAIGSKDVSAVIGCAHKCKGASATCGFTGAANIFDKLESLARDGSLPGASNLLSEAKAAFEQVREALKNRSNL